MHSVASRQEQMLFQLACPNKDISIKETGGSGWGCYEEGICEFNTDGWRENK